ncbi:uncharacterized protein BDCG_08212 [Blastomyces dermatitidis ER-3]|uniref:Armadillo-like helical domain-containing protein n=3 Tax=Blastomyces TaxID=229219 RepID=A0A179UI93_BLAGS|nr:uncharacterized protein BDBG_03522 [Blastomyces gilchristii SLH14081]XP_045272807.1 uncharacterized protein BDCG_08212 [Blastomyces dermatitidis ER-3]EGE79286.1 hypothetical protein BDDG_02225 [Blastomyces dermatitidis ATCC 18188]EQL35705.1 hypothetical protein BDFG_02644 [Blastomyces dermatitidis ATCC 26199]EEQ84943.2 hypothetical protein BDCG_08212 [Blastomyces dermatitidis ER-3]OAT07463.1 hypothetical protein BDBG_03522 [Blastomyces gilchristii SLH14081]
MEASPLTQQSRPDTFQPKIVKLYETLFLNPEYAEPSEGFWREFFLLPPERVRLSQILDGISPDEILQIHFHTQQLFSRAVKEAASGKSPSNLQALETLTTLLGGVLTKKYTNPSSDIITVLAGIDEVDHVIADFVAALDGIIRNGATSEIRIKAVEAAISMTSGGYKTSLISYFMHRDIFPALMKFVHDSDTRTQIFEPFVLLGLLSNYNKFEFQNPYQLRLDDFVNESTIQKIVNGAGATCTALRNGYVAVQDDLPEGWNLSSTLAFFGLGVLAPSRRAKTPLTPEEAKARFGVLPCPEATILLAIYDFINANKLFAFSFVSFMPEKRSEESPFSSFLSLTSYLLQHAYRSPRVTLYAETTLFSLRILVEEPFLCKQICSEEMKRPIRLCRQRAPYLPLIQGERILATVIFDIMIDTINHNLRRELDVALYCHTISILLRLLTYVSSNQTRLAYHWSELWRTLLTLTRFMTTYAKDLTSNPQIHNLATSLIDLIAFCISAGDTFLPDPASYDDLFYKVVETGPILARFKDTYERSLSSSSPAALSASTDSATPSIDTLISVASHFHSLLFLADKPKDTKTATQTPTSPTTSTEILATGKKKNLSPREVHQIIKQGYDTLSIRSQEGLNLWEKWREADWKAELKRIARCAVEDARIVVVSKAEQTPVLVDTSVGGGGGGGGGGKQVK